MRRLPALVALGGFFALFATGSASAQPGVVDPGFRLTVFGDAYGGWQTAKQGAPQPAHRTFALNAPGQTAENGFSLSLIGLDATWMSKADAFGVVTSLRFGPSVAIYHGNSSTQGIDNITQGYVTWKPVDALTLDLGQFNSIFGAEAIESWQNLNYTRGVMFNITPYWHTGLRASYEITDAFSVTAIVVNGINTITEDDEAPSVGVQFGYSPSPKFSVLLGGLVAGDSATDPSGFDNYFDLIATAALGDTTIIFNALYNINVDAALPDGSTDDATLFGAALRIGQALTPTFGVAVRYEIFGDANNTVYQVPGADSVILHTATLTLDFKPFKGFDNFVLRWDNRYETASEDIFSDGDAMPGATWFASVVGVVVHSDVIGGQ